MKNNSIISKSISITLIALTVLTSSVFFSGCATNPEPQTKTAVFFDTFVTVTIYDNVSDTILDECFDICQKYENMFSATNPQSDIYKLNHSQGNSVNVNPETIALISDSIKYSELTSGKYDITIYSDSMLWDFHSPDNQIPDDSLIKESLNHINYKYILIDNNNSCVTLSDSECKIDLGSIAKGYIADKIYDYLLTQNVKSAIINMGGDLRVMGLKPNNEYFKIGIQNPNSKDDIIASLKLTDCSVATSGTYERYIEKDGIKMHHILDPFTGYPANTDIDSVTIITDSAETADALCTSIILIGKDAALPLLESLDNTEAIILTTDNTMYKTSGVDKHIN